MNKSYPFKKEFKVYLRQEGMTKNSIDQYSSYLNLIFEKFLPEMSVNMVELCNQIENGNPKAPKALDDVRGQLSKKKDTDPKLKNYISGLGKYINFIATTIRCKPVMVKFASRIRTQDRPISNPNVPCFPIALIIWAAKNIDKNSWKEIQETILEVTRNVHVITGNGVAHIKDAENIYIKDGKMYTIVDGVSYPIYTATADGRLEPMKTEAQDVSEALSKTNLDHFTSISRTLKERSSEYPKLLELTKYMCSYADENKLPLKASSYSLDGLMKHMMGSQEVLQKLREQKFFPNLAKEFCDILRVTTFTLMDEKENKKKGSGNDRQ